MRLLFIGDIVGKAGRKILSENLARLRSELNLDFIIANAENAAGGNGITKNMANELFRAGVDAITLGDHLWDQRVFESEIDSIENLCRPANIPAGNPGKEFVVLERNSIKLGVFCLMGQTLMKLKADCPFAAANRVIEKLAPECDAMFVDFHSETSSEKVSMGWHLDGRVAGVVGTHTHIQTNDARVFPQGTAFLSDAGMTGPWESCLGRDWRGILDKFIDGRPRRFTMAEFDVRICGCLIDYDVQAHFANSVETFVYPPFLSTGEARKSANEEFSKPAKEEPIQQDKQETQNQESSKTEE